jgi:hypothetical protein
LILAANNLSVAGALQAIGGNGGSSGFTLGGGGGGGRIVLYANTLNTNGMNWSSAGGAKGTGGSGSGGSDGSVGTFRYAGDDRTDDPLGGNLTYPFVSVALPPQIGTPSVTNVTATSATLQAHLITDGGVSTTVSVFWGTTNGGTTAAAWANTNSFAAGQWGTGSNPTTNIVTLAANQNYYSRFYAVNSASSSWAPALNFITGTLSLQVLDATCGVSAADTAVVQVTRPSACTNETLPVYYTTGGNATNNADYSASPASGSLVISNGQTSALLTLTPLSPWNNGAPRNFTVSLLPGPYVTGTANSATCTLGHYVSSLAYSGTTFTESYVNDGSIANSITVTMPTNSSGGYLDLFSGVNGDDFTADGKVVFSGVPAGLSASAIRTATNTVVLALNGSASNYLSSASITNLGVAFLDGAFAGGNTTIVANASSLLSVTFVSAYVATNWYVSTTGSDTNSGTFTSPFATVQKAVNMARANANDVIHLLPGTYTQSGIGVGTVVTITGNTSADTILQAAATPFTATNLTIISVGENFTLKNITLRNATWAAITCGVATPIITVNNCQLVQNSITSASLNGGAICWQNNYSGNGQLNVFNTIISSNQAVAGGGGIGDNMTAVAVSNCVFIGNNGNTVAAYGSSGGAMSIEVPLTVWSSSFISNSAANAGAVNCGNPAVFYNSTFAFNTATNAGGAITAAQNMTTFVNCTFYGNSATNGGAISYFSNGGANLYLYNSTVFSNNAMAAGGGIYVFGNAYLTSTIMAGNTAATAPDGCEVSGANFYDSYALVGNNTNVNNVTAGWPNANHSYIGSPTNVINALLLPLANNGGPLPNCALQAGSVAINHGSNPLGLAWDARGTGYARQTGLAVDIGAFEYGSRLPVTGMSILFR